MSRPRPLVPGAIKRGREKSSIFTYVPGDTGLDFFVQQYRSRDSLPKENHFDSRPSPTGISSFVLLLMLLVCASNVTRTTAVHHAMQQLNWQATKCNSRTNHARSPRAFKFRQISSSGKDSDVRDLPSLPQANNAGDASGERCSFFAVCYTE